MEGTDVSLWMDPKNPTYRKSDVITNKGESHTVVRYSGSTDRRLDRWVLPGAKFFRRRKKNRLYMYIGVVVSVVTIGTDTKDGKEVTMFEIVIRNEETQAFRVKTDACARFGWAPLTNYSRVPGIIHHTRA